MAGGYDRWWPPPSRPRPADGIKARSRRGAIGSTWWSQRFISVLESFDLGARLTRGRRYARAGQVLGLEIGPGEVRAQVQGSRARPYQVSVRVLPLSEKDWARVEEALAARAAFLARLLAGEMPSDIEEAFAACRLSLFPASRTDLATDCSCPDWANPCKHVAATYYLLAEAFDDNPFLIFRWRGREREALLARLSAREGSALAGASASGPGAGVWAPPTVDATPLEDCLAHFFEPGNGLAALGPAASPRAAPVPDAALRELDDPGIEVRGRPLAEILAPAYAAMTQAAERRLLGGGEEG
jgi:uncharacterized Zn finger protein